MPTFDTHIFLPSLGSIRNQRSKGSTGKLYEKVNSCCLKLPRYYSILFNLSRKLIFLGAEFPDCLAVKFEVYQVDFTRSNSIKLFFFHNRTVSLDGPTRTYSKQGLWLAGRIMPMPLSLKTIGSAGYRDQWNKRVGCVLVNRARLQNNPYFCLFKYARTVKQQVWSEAENGKSETS